MELVCMHCSYVIRHYPPFGDGAVVYGQCNICKRDKKNKEIPNPKLQIPRETEPQITQIEDNSIRNPGEYELIKADKIITDEHRKILER